ncbi:unnamed protein product [Mytilus edulis]|uniref:Neurotransmitter-gated ion-channel ligand-binding domain-containing protein n=1 Tax=Mytilus edulis TaxID=6550 RepID=A0A8S3PZE2_MYTED|nr:unnamed protein product [Mytilus edulis]
MNCLETINHELILRNVLFNESRYSSQVIPRRNVTENVEIVMKWNFIRLEGLFEKEARLSQSIGMDLKWKDDYLVWDPSLYGGKSYLTASGKEVWTPDFTIFNRLESSFLSDGLQAEKVLVKYDGTINAQPYGELSTICNADTASFPADCTKCNIIIGASVVSQQHIFVWDENESLTGFEDNKDSHAFWEIWRLEKLPIVASFAEIHIYLLRLPAHYINNIVIPASALSILAVLAFFIPIEEGERLGFGMTIFLSFMVLMLQMTVFIKRPSHDFNDQQEVTGDTKQEPLEQHDNTTNYWKIIAYQRLMKYFRPLQIFDLVTLLSCFITTVCAHVELFNVMNIITYSNVE